MKNMFSKGAHPSEFGHRQTTMLMLGLFLLVSQCLFAQSRIIKGTVYDEHKDALMIPTYICVTSRGRIYSPT
jgi:TonB-dependent starch-binding outer membrane protein SusC